MPCIFLHHLAVVAQGRGGVGYSGLTVRLATLALFFAHPGRVAEALGSWPLPTRFRFSFLNIYIHIF